MGRLFCMTLVLLFVFSLAEHGMLILYHNVGGHSMLQSFSGREGDGAAPVCLFVQGVPQKVLREDDLRRELPLRREARALREEGNPLS